MLFVSHLEQKFDHQTIFQDINFELKEADNLVILGKSGCGKTTLLNLISGMIQPTTGTITLNHQNIQKPTSDIAFILQNFGLLPWKTILQNVELGLKIKGISRQERRQKAISILNTLEIYNRENDYPGTLSGGEQQRVAIARAYAMEPKLLLMDEPFSSLDALTREKLQDTLLNTWQKIKVPYIMVTHSIEEAAFLGKKIAIFSGKPATFSKVFANVFSGNTRYRNSDQYYQMIKKIRSYMEQNW
ncbi:MAG: ABC transporter ATP-binding protein [Deltaproteobacteria bacterium]|jgi:ABC-type nitrate/sulfonate/bicarbonate transport system ATPase subunit|nr:ABC transporter ATP-binding protein [Deltaproteobacteria bacterium]